MTDSAKPRHVVVLCHPEPGSFNAAIAAKYCAVVEACGQQAVLRNLYDMRFDPVLRTEERPGSRAFVQCPHVAYELGFLDGADVVVFVYPIWFGLPPAMLKGYVDRVLGSDFSFGAMRDPNVHSRLAGAHLLSFTTSGNSQIWLEEQGQWQSLIQVFDRYLQATFALAATSHVHFAPITAPLNPRFFAQYMDNVAEAARTRCAAALARHTASPPGSG